jgi:hypothetical protein
MIFKLAYICEKKKIKIYSILRHVIQYYVRKIDYYKF